eukprot:COSAG06_NODE_949_length_11356_cov_2.462112_8_plen_68_part_00
MVLGGICDDIVETAAPAVLLAPRYDPLELRKSQTQNQNQIYSLEQYTVIPIATYSFVPPGYGCNSNK